MHHHRHQEKYWHGQHHKIQEGKLEETMQAEEGNQGFMGGSRLKLSFVPILSWGSPLE